MKFIIKLTFTVNFLFSSVLFAQEQVTWLMKESGQTKSAWMTKYQCRKILLNPHLGADIYSLKCNRAFDPTVVLKNSFRQIEREIVWRPFSNPRSSKTETNDPMLIDQWALDLMNIQSFWSQAGTGSKIIKVAVIDTGVDYFHEDLATSIDINTKEIPENGIDEDGNGYVDDVYGWNAFDNLSDPTAVHHHGTHIIGTIGAATNNGIGIAGIIGNSAIIPIRFFSKNGAGSTESAIRAFDYAVARGAKIINVSWGGSKDSPLLRQTIARCRDKGILVIAAAGNESTDNDQVPSYPASFDLDNLISVAAVNLTGELSSFSNWGAKSVHVAAPGESILSTVSGTRYGYMEGTSMATPHIVGIAALIWSEHLDWNYQQVRNYIFANCKQSISLQKHVACGGYFSF